jgi:hypothetical protein
MGFKGPEALAKGNLHLVDENAWAPSFYRICTPRRRVFNARARTLVLVPAVITQATPPTSASGKWYYTPWIESTRFADGNMFMEAYTDDPPDIWEGTFEGNSEDVYTGVIHSTGAWNANGVAFFEGVVGGREGTLVIWFLGSKPDMLADWTGKWVILRGTGELANLRGQGRWWGQGAPDIGVEGFVFYSGKIHFDPS